MAIAFARCEFVKRSAGHHAVKLSAYLSCSLVKDENTGRVYGKEWLRHADTVVSNRMLMPEGASPRFAEMSTAWSCVERSERRRDSQVAFHVVAALDPSLSPAEWIEQAEEFARRHWVSKGLGVQYAIHNPHPHAATEGERENPHVHYEVMTRRVEGDSLCKLKARDLMPVVRRWFGRGHVVEADAWGKLWGEYQDEYFKARKLALRVDPVGVHPQEHTGPRRRLRKDDPRVRRNEERRVLNERHRDEFMTVARELSPKLRKLEAERNAHRVGWHSRNAAIERHHKPGIEKAAQKMEDRWAQMSIARRALHLTGMAIDALRPHRKGWVKTTSALRDIDYEKARDEKSMRAWNAAQRPVIKRQMHVDIGRALNRQIETELDAIRPEVLAVMARRKRFEEARAEKLEDHIAMSAPRFRRTDTL